MAEGDKGNVGVRHERLVARLIEAAGEELGGVSCYTGGKEYEWNTNEPVRSYSLVVIQLKAWCN